MLVHRPLGFEAALYNNLLSLFTCRSVKFFAASLSSDAIDAGLVYVWTVFEQGAEGF